MLHTTPSGLLIIDKPQGVTSFDAVAAVRGALHIKKVGHAGTLDPMATGTLVIAFGHATRLLNAIVAHDKTYEATIRLGLRTTTDDAEGEVLVDDEARSRWQTLSAQLTEGGQSGEPTASPTASWQDLLTRTIATNFTGDIEQVPNTFSAIKINGQRAYDLAREGKEVELKPRPVTISEFTVLNIRSGFVAGEQAAEPLREDANTGAIPALDVDVRVSCSSGTYIRALARDLGNELGVGGYLTRCAVRESADSRCRTMPADLSLLRRCLAREPIPSPHIPIRRRSLIGKGKPSRATSAYWTLLKVLPVTSAATGCLTMPSPWNRPLEVRCRRLTSLLRRPANYASAAVSSVRSASPLPPLCRKRMMWRRLSSVPTLIRPSRSPYSPSRKVDAVKSAA